MTRISERDLVLPALYIILKQPGITTAELIIELRNIFNPIGEDAEILQGRNDDKFSQIVRNLVSHHTLDERFGYTVLDDTKGVNTKHTLSIEGENFLQDNLLLIENLLSNNVGYIETLKGIEEIDKSQSSGRKLHIFDENIFISEGRGKTVTTKVYERSKKLRDAAIAHYTKNDKIVCEACGFDFYSVYGEIGHGYIEIHHQKPVFQYEEIDFLVILANALKDLVPLCANCHRIIHRKRENPLSLAELKQIIANPNS